ncbi:21123_t:CDS:2 [Gigaspora margarita]|uniref:21123_t:CDS:1 n=1 Tax=Gigaspora margarita TaxID=4874 RepID=A0ABN7UP61_GIGMA|nr:21123_t:CDS:2 [Gigaspora margarita]
MTNNTKLYSRLGYSANLECIIGSTFSYDQTRVEHYNEVEPILQSIISNNAIAKQVRLYLLQEYQQAWDLAKVLSMVNRNDKLFDFLNTFEKQSNPLDNENTKNDFSDDFNSLSQNNELSDSYAIAIVASTLADFNTINICDDDVENDLRDACLELAFLVSAQIL